MRRKDAPPLEKQPELDLVRTWPNPVRRQGNYDFLSPAKATVVFDSFWKLAKVRQDIFYRRLAGYPPPWTSDPILRQHKFTNAYRASDRVSQYLIRNVIYKGQDSARETIFRILLFKLFNRIETWERLTAEFGAIEAKSFKRERYQKALDKVIDTGQRLYSAAYIMPSGGPGSSYARKHHMHLWLLEKLLDEQLPERIEEASSMRSAFQMLLNLPSIGDFLAYQYVTDINYSECVKFSEMEFVVPGPGARSGLRKCFSDFGGLSEAEIIQVVAQRQCDCIQAAEVDFLNLWGRPLQLIDIQNLFCEVDKYARVAHPDIVGISGRSRIKQRFSPTGPMVAPWYPPKWKINQQINERSINVYASRSGDG